MIFFIKQSKFFFLFYKTSVFNRQSCCFSAITNAAMTVNEHWPTVILSADIHSCLHIQKKEEKCFIRSYHSVFLLIHSQVFDFNINIQFCYLFYIVLSFFFFFSFMVLVKVHKLYKSIEQSHCYLEFPKTKLHWVNGLLSIEIRFKLVVKLYPTSKTKQI